jgi:hypothetical protein
MDILPESIPRTTHFMISITKFRLSTITLLFFLKLNLEKLKLFLKRKYSTIPGSLNRDANQGLTMNHLDIKILSMNYPALKGIIKSSFEANQVDSLIDFLFNLETDPYNRGH